MARVDEYKNIVLQALEEHKSPRSSAQPDEEHDFIVADGKNVHYQLMSIGWKEAKRVYGCLVHLDIIEGKIWVQYDGIETGITERLLELGVPKEDIVLGFQMPFKRKFSGFATG